MGMKPLTAPEKDEGTDALAALLYQEGVVFDARIMVGLWLFAVASPRLADKAMRKAAEKDKAAQLVGPNGRPVRELSPVPVAK